MELIVYCADIGSVVRGRFGWARSEEQGEVRSHRGGTEIVDLVEAVAADLGDRRAVALGFECPLFVPIPEEPLRLGAARAGEPLPLHQPHGHRHEPADLQRQAPVAEVCRQRQPARDASPALEHTNAKVTIVGETGAALDALVTRESPLDPNMPIAEQLALLDARTRAMQERHNQLRQDLSVERIKWQAADAEEREARLAAIDRLGRRLSELAGGGLHVEWWGVAAFMLGTILSTIPDELA